MKDKITKKIFNNNLDYDSAQNFPNLNKDEKQLMFEQYKLLIDSAQKTEEKRGASNNFFVTLNTAFASFMISDPAKLQNLETKYLPWLAIAGIMGIIIALDWLKIINVYKKLNSNNLAVIQVLEQVLPTAIFSSLAEMEAKPRAEKTQKFNLVLIHEKVLPIIFLTIYIFYILLIVYVFITS